jgi:hypothetical protein
VLPEKGHPEQQNPSSSSLRNEETRTPVWRPILPLGGRRSHLVRLGLGGALRRDLAPEQRLLTEEAPPVGPSPQRLQTCGRACSNRQRCRPLPDKSRSDQPGTGIKLLALFKGLRERCQWHRRHPRQQVGKVLG